MAVVDMVVAVAMEAVVAMTEIVIVVVHVVVRRVVSVHARHAVEAAQDHVPDHKEKPSEALLPEFLSYLSTYYNDSNFVLC